MPGLEQLIVEMRNLPKDLAREASGIVVESAEDAGAEVRDKYPNKTGDLKSKVRVTRVAKGQFGAGAQVQNTSPLAFIFENGSEVRRTKEGWFRGRMPPGRVFIPTMRKHRRRMYERLKALLESKGLQVTGDER
jgi:hypothetical protein